jgi:hypothetical protein
VPDEEVVTVMSMHKLTAGSGYDYLTKKVARNDATVPGVTPLADYYDEKGEAPGVWVGSGLAGIEGLNEGDTVTAEQMTFLFGQGEHPLAAEKVVALGPNPTEAQHAAPPHRVGRPPRQARLQDHPRPGRGPRRALPGHPDDEARGPVPALVSSMAVQIRINPLAI